MDRGQLTRSGRVLAPSLFTMGNMACGFAAVMYAHVDEYFIAGCVILLGIVFDMLDGRVARLVHGESSFGVEFDSLADFLSFCVAPGFVMYTLFLKDYGTAGTVVAFLYALCGGLRLARFNALANAGGGSKTHFQGLPTPAAAGLLASLVLLYTMVERETAIREMPFVMAAVPRIASLAPFVMVVLSFLMVSNVPYAAFKQADLLHPKNLRLLFGTICGMTLIYFYPENAIFLIFLGYVLSGFTGLITRHHP